MGKDFKIWGFGYGLIGDLIASLPLLTYFEKKYPGSYKIFVIEKKCAQAVELFVNHPLIDRIKVTDNWDGVGETDREIAGACDIRDSAWQDVSMPRGKPGGWHSPKKWYNHYSFVEEIARLYGVDVDDFNEVLTEEEKLPRLCRWFDIGFDKSKEVGGYSHNNSFYMPDGKIANNIAIWPFAGYGDSHGRSPSEGWWGKCISELIRLGFSVHHFGLDKKILSDSSSYVKYTEMSFFEQIRLSLASELVVGCESGPMWIHGAHMHPAVHLMTNWMSGHLSNLLSLNPVNINSDVLFNKESCDHIPLKRVVDSIQMRKEMLDENANIRNN